MYNVTSLSFPNGHFRLRNFPPGDHKLKKQKLQCSQYFDLKTNSAKSAKSGNVNRDTYQWPHKIDNVRREIQVNVSCFHSALDQNEVKICSRKGTSRFTLRLCFTSMRLVCDRKNSPSPPTVLQVGHGFSKSFVGKVLLRIKWKIKLINGL